MLPSIISLSVTRRATKVCDFRHGCILLLRHRFISSSRSQQSRASLSLHKTVQTIWIVPLSLAAYNGYKTFIKQRNETKPSLKDIDKIPPVELPKNPDEIKTLANHKVKLRGRFDHENEFLLAQRPNLRLSPNQLISLIDKTGYYVLTPFVLEDDRRVLVNRGWVSKFHKDPQSRTLGQVQGTIELNAYVSLEENLDLITRLRTAVFSLVYIYRSDTVDNVLNMEQLAKKLNVDPVALFVADNDSGQKMGPISGQFNLETSNILDEYKTTIF